MARLEPLLPDRTPQRGGRHPADLGSPLVRVGKGPGPKVCLNESFDVSHALLLVSGADVVGEVASHETSGRVDMLRSYRDFCRMSLTVPHLGQ